MSIIRKRNVSIEAPQDGWITAEDVELLAVSNGINPPRRLSAMLHGEIVTFYTIPWQLTYVNGALCMYDSEIDERTISTKSAEYGRTTQMEVTVGGGRLAIRLPRSEFEDHYPREANAERGAVRVSSLTLT